MLMAGATAPPLSAPSDYETDIESSVATPVGSMYDFTLKNNIKTKNVQKNILNFSFFCSSERHWFCDLKILFSVPEESAEELTGVI